MTVGTGFLPIPSPQPSPNIGEGATNLNDFHGNPALACRCMVLH